MTDNTVIVTTPEAIRAVIAEEIGKVIPQLAEYRRKTEEAETDTLTLRAAVRFLIENGIPSSPSSLYNYVYRDAIPYRKLGNRTLFSKRELLEWIEGRTVRPDDGRCRAAKRIAESAARKV